MSGRITPQSLENKTLEEVLSLFKCRPEDNLPEVLAAFINDAPDGDNQRFDPGVEVVSLFEQLLQYQDCLTQPALLADLETYRQTLLPDGAGDPQVMDESQIEMHSMEVAPEQLRRLEDGSLLVQKEGAEYLVPLRPEVYQLLKREPQQLTLPALRREDVLLVDRLTIQQLMMLQGNNPISLDAVVYAYPNARFSEDGPRLSEIAQMRLPDSTRLGQYFFRPDGSLGLSQSTPFKNFLETNAPTIAQLMTTEREHENPDCHTMKAFGISECNPDKWPTTYGKLIQNGQRLVVDLTGNDLPRELLMRRQFIVRRLLQAKADGELPQVTFSDDRESLMIDLRDPVKVRELLAFIDRESTLAGSRAYCDPSDVHNMDFYSGVQRAPDDVTVSDRDVYLATASFFGNLSSELMRIEFDPAITNDPARFNQLIERPSVVASVSIPFSYLERGEFNRAVFSYTFASAMSFLPRGGIWSGRIYETGEGRPYHQGDNESLRGIVSWEDPSSLTIDEFYANEHGGFVPIDPKTTNGVIATGYRSGALMELEKLPPDEDGVVIGRTGYTGTLSPGSSAAISVADFDGRGFNATEGVVTRGVLARQGPPAAALFYPIRQDGTPIQTRYPGLNGVYNNAQTIGYELSVEDPFQARFRFYLGRKGQGEPGVNTSDEGKLIRNRTAVIDQDTMGRSVVFGVAPVFAPRSLEPGVSLFFQPQTESRFGGGLLGSFHLFFPLHDRTLDWPRTEAHILTSIDGDPELHVDLDLIHAGVGYNAGPVKILANVDIGVTANTPLTRFDPEFGVYLSPGAYLAIPFADLYEAQIGTDFRLASNEFPHDSGHHWEFVTAVKFLRRFNLSLHR